MAVDLLEPYKNPQLLKRQFSPSYLPWFPVTLMCCCTLRPRGDYSILGPCISLVSPLLPDLSPFIKLFSKLAKWLTSLFFPCILIGGFLYNMPGIRNVLMYLDAKGGTTLILYSTLQLMKCLHSKTANIFLLPDRKAQPHGLNSIRWLSCYTWTKVASIYS